MSFHCGAEDGVYAGLVALPLAPQPGKHIGVQPALPLIPDKPCECSYIYVITVWHLPVHLSTGLLLLMFKELLLEKWHDRFGIHWPDLDEDLSTEGLLRGAPAARESIHERS